MINDHIHVDVYAMLLAVLHHVYELRRVPGPAYQLVRHRLIPGPPVAQRHLLSDMRWYFSMLTVCVEFIHD